MLQCQFQRPGFFSSLLGASSGAEQQAEIPEQTGVRVTTDTEYMSTAGRCIDASPAILRRYGGRARDRQEFAASVGADTAPRSGMQLDQGPAFPTRTD